jgi:sec-independent protein translocase protein TatA
MARLFDNPMALIILLAVLLLLFGAPRLPGMARSLGQSMRIFKSEVRELTDDAPEAADPGREATPMRKGRTRSPDEAIAHGSHP